MARAGYQLFAARSVCYIGKLSCCNIAARFRTMRPYESLRLVAQQRWQYAAGDSRPLLIKLLASEFWCKAAALCDHGKGRDRMHKQNILSLVHGQTSRRGGATRPADSESVMPVPVVTRTKKGMNCCCFCQ